MLVLTGCRVLLGQIFYVCSVGELENLHVTCEAWLLLSCGQVLRLCRDKMRKLRATCEMHVLLMILLCVWSWAEICIGTLVCQAVRNIWYISYLLYCSVIVSYINHLMCCSVMNFQEAAVLLSFFRLWRCEGWPVWQISFFNNKLIKYYFLTALYVMLSERKSPHQHICSTKN